MVGSSRKNVQVWGGRGVNPWSEASSSFAARFYDTPVAFLPVNDEGWAKSEEGVEKIKKRGLGNGRLWRKKKWK